jgi:hypothetical protein
MQGVCTGLDRVLEDSALRLHDDAHGVWAGLAILQRPEADCGVVQDLPQRPKLLTTKSVKGPERCGPSLHGKLGGGSSAKAGRVTLHRTGAPGRGRSGGGRGELVAQGAVWGWAEMAKAQSTAWELCTVGPMYSHPIPLGKCATRFWRLPWSISQQPCSPRGNARSSSMRKQE